MEGTEVRKLAALEDAHWWYRERRHLLSRMVDGVTPGTALDIGAAGGGNTRVLQAAGWSVAALEYGADGAEVAADRGLAVLRVLRPGGRFLIAVPADPRLWSEHDVAVDHVRRYTRTTLGGVLVRNGFEVTRMRSWNVLLRPVVAVRRRTSSGSDLDTVHPLVNLALRGVVAVERVLPVKAMPGVTLLAEARPRR